MEAQPGQSGKSLSELNADFEATLAAIRHNADVKDGKAEGAKTGEQVANDKFMEAIKREGAKGSELGDLMGGLGLDNIFGGFTKPKGGK